MHLKPLNWSVTKNPIHAHSKPLNPKNSSLDKKLFKPTQKKTQPTPIEKAVQPTIKNTYEVEMTSLPIKTVSLNPHLTLFSIDNDSMGVPTQNILAKIVEAPNINAITRPRPCMHGLNV